MDNKAHHQIAREKGKMAEGRIAGCLRGGYAYKGYFSASGPVNSFHVAKIKDTQEFKLLTQS